MPPNEIEWEASEFEYRPKSPEWYWAVGIVGGAAALGAFIFQNILLALFLLIGTFAILMFGGKHPERVVIRLTDKGVVVKDHFYPYQTLTSYSIDEHRSHPRLSLLSKERMVEPYVRLALPSDIEVGAIRAFLKSKVKEAEHPGSLTEKVGDLIGF